MIERILPRGVAVQEAYGDLAGALLFPEEETAVARAVPKRRREYATTRHCARIALRRLGHAPAPVLRGPNREPLWPEGVVGALTHCDGYRAAAVAWAGAPIASLGIDAEPHLPLPDGVRETVTRPEELPHLAELAAREPEVHWDRLLFSAKESVYKAWFPLARSWLDFEDATLRFTPSRRTFEASLHRTGPLTAVRGRWLIEGGLVVTSVVV
ncbi:4'-phosphopantetheinyl transferase family protein [Streptomyces vilmorinianum]|uniref:4'-phosphopantetheinyl transferase family protein n=1 Tax=Streptomyces vilmorinianum TaxID=3051092 RepID=UPI0010FB8FDC|nr:4'-phosphopantetheinyl transferase superfamily protein [Streptomyces vilmorinianum]